MQMARIRNTGVLTDAADDESVMKANTNFDLLEKQVTELHF